MLKKHKLRFQTKRSFKNLYCSYNHAILPTYADDTICCQNDEFLAVLEDVYQIWYL